MRWQARNFEFGFPRPALVMGILNVTPDSFSDGGRYFSTEAAVARGIELASEGAEIIDVGGESTRPGATPVEAAEELRRVLPVISELAAQIKIPISIDTQKPSVARAAIQAGASIVNDIAAHRTEGAMFAVIRETGAGYIMMHMQGTPATMQTQPHYGSVVEEVKEFFRHQLQRLQEFGVKEEQIVLDAGIGFGKTVAHNLQLLAGMQTFASFGRPLMVGVSRKSFLAKIDGGAKEGDRLAGGLAATVLSAQAGVSIFRTHDVAPTMAALRVLEAIRSAGS